MRDLLKSVGKHGLIYGIGDFLGKSISFLLIPIYTAYLDPSEYGTLDILDLTGFLVGLFISMGIVQAVIRYHHEYDDKRSQDQVVSSAWLASVVVALPVLLILWWQADLVSALIFKGASGYGRFFRILFATLAFNITLETPMAWLRALERSVTFAAINLVRLVTVLSFNILFLVRYDMGVRGILLSSLITAIVVSLLTAVIFFREVRFRPSWPMLKQLLAFGIPLIGGWLGSFILNYSDRYFLKEYTSLADIGIYSLSYKLGMIPTVAVTMPFMMAWGPKSFAVEKGNPEAARVFGRVFTYFIGLQFLLVLAFSANAHEIIGILADESYARSAWFIAPLMMAYAFQGVQQYSQFGLLLRKRTKYIGILVMVAAVVNIGLNSIFVPRYGVAGASWTTLASFALLVALIVPMSQKSFAIRYEGGRILKLAVVAALVGWAVTRLEIDNEWLSMVLKSSAILIAVPLLLWVARFYNPSEIAAVRSFLKRSQGPENGMAGTEHDE